MRRCTRVAQLLQIEPLLGRKPSQLSGGQRQRVAMGRALVRDPELFLFDEPLSNLDAKLRVEMRTEIKKLHQRLGTTIVYVTHDQVEAMTLASRIAVMHQGSIQQFAEPRTTYERPANMFVAGFMGSPPMNFIPARLAAGGNRPEVRDRERRHGAPPAGAARRRVAAGVARARAGPGRPAGEHHPSRPPRLRRGRARSASSRRRSRWSSRPAPRPWS